MTKPLCHKCGTSAYVVTTPPFVFVHDRRRLKVDFHATRCRQCQSYQFPMLKKEALPADQVNGRAELLSVLIADVEQFHRDIRQRVTESDRGGLFDAVLLKLFSGKYARSLSLGRVEIVLDDLPTEASELIKGSGVRMVQPEEIRAKEEDLIGDRVKSIFQVIQRCISAHQHGRLRLKDEPAEMALLFFLTGPSGVGKTLLANSIAKTLNRSLVKISGADIMTKWQGESAQRLRELFSSLKQKWDSGEECILYLNEFDSLSANSGSSQLNHDAQGINAELNRLIDEYPGIVFLDTNYLEYLRPSHLSRGFQFEFTLPTDSERAEFIDRRWPDGAPKLSAGKREKIVNQSRAFSFREMRKLLTCLLATSQGEEKIDDKCLDEAFSFVSTTKQRRESQVVRRKELARVLRTMTNKITRGQLEQNKAIEKRLRAMDKQIQDALKKLER